MAAPQNTYAMNNWMNLFRSNVCMNSITWSKCVEWNMKENGPIFVCFILHTSYLKKENRISNVYTVCESHMNKWPFDCIVLVYCIIIVSIKIGYTFEVSHAPLLLARLFLARLSYIVFRSYFFLLFF